VRDEYCLAGSEANDEPLMAAALQVIRQNVRYYAFAFDLNIARPIFEGAPYFAVLISRNPIVVGFVTA